MALLILSLVAALAALAAKGVGRVQPALPRVERSSLWISTVARSHLRREIRAPGILVPENLRWITALSPARVESIALDAGDRIEPGTPIMRLSNPDSELAALEAESELAAARAELANIEASLGTQILAQKAALAAHEATSRQAERTAEANLKLADVAAIPSDELAASRDQWDASRSSLALERERLDLLGRARRAQIAAHTARVQRLESVVAFRNRQVAELEIRASTSGVIRAIPVELGQWVNPGSVLATVLESDALKAELRVSESLTKDLAIGQHVRVDTHDGIASGRLARIDPAVREGTVIVDVTFVDALPPSARPDLSIDGVIEIEHADDVLQLRRPGQARPGVRSTLFRLEDEGQTAVRVPVQFGRASVDAIEVVEGLSIGDQVIVSDMSGWDGNDRVALY